MLASRFDLSCDYVIRQLRRIGCKYLRINSEDLSGLTVSLDPLKSVLNVYAEDKIYQLDKKLRAIYFRRPVFLREYDTSFRDPIEQFQRHQWATFIRNFMVFDKSLWMNHPTATYYAEHKAIQLQTAKKVGFSIPETIFGNTIERNSFKKNKNNIVVKGVDTVLLRSGDTETFGYTKIFNSEKISAKDISSVPAIFQELLDPKTDIRVTVIKTKVFAAKILLNKKTNIRGDWRQFKDRVLFERIALPQKV